jgi:hypothetical protein
MTTILSRRETASLILPISSGVQANVGSCGYGTQPNRKTKNKEMRMIYLWTDGKGWQPFELTDTAELENRGITIGEGVSIGNWTFIGEGASIGIGTSIGDRVFMGIWVFIGTGAFIGKGASIGEGASIGKVASIRDGARPCIIHIVGSRYPVSYWGEDRIDIGGVSRTINAWLTDYTDIAKMYNFTVGELKEYRPIVELINSIHKQCGGHRMNNLKRTLPLTAAEGV